MVSRRRYLATVGSAVGAVLAGCGGGGDPPVVDMTDDLTFEPASLAVDVGTTVTWDNVGVVGHSVTAYGDGLPEGAAFFASGGFASEAAARRGWPEGRIIGGDTYEYTFETAGSYPYFCIPHERGGMRGVIEVG